MELNRFAEREMRSRLQEDFDEIEPEESVEGV
jgi:hypothetical protein